MKPKKIGKIEAIHLVAAALDAHKKRGTPEFDKAQKFSDELKEIWRKQLWEKKKCPHCGNEIDCQD